jgi:hypothetical protein
MLHRSDGNRIAFLAIIAIYNFGDPRRFTSPRFQPAADVVDARGDDAGGDAAPYERQSDREIRTGHLSNGKMMWHGDLLLTLSLVVS